MSHLTTRHSKKSVWGGPILVGTVTCAGLIAALLGTGTWDAISWISLALPIGVSAYYWKI